MKAGNMIRFNHSRAEIADFLNMLKNKVQAKAGGIQLLSETMGAKSAFRYISSLSHPGRSVLNVITPG